jgi:hypothetical protein
MAIRYDSKTKRVKQKISTLSMYSFEGEFFKAIKYLQDELKSLKEDYTKSTKQIMEYDYKGGAYSDGAREKKVSFDKFFIEEGEYEGDKELQIWGERDILPEEIEGLKEKERKEEASRTEYKRKQFEILKKEFGE